MGYAPLVAVVRGGLDESIHYGAVALAAADGEILASVGRPETVTYMRSSAKPLQMLPVLESGAAERFGLSLAEIAVGIGSHSGEPRHVEAVGSILARLGLKEQVLRCGTHPPFHRATAARLEAEGRPPSVLHSNCSGKHAAMLALCLQRGFPVEGYERPEHPVQREILRAVAALTGREPGSIHLGIDGCTVPTFGVSLGAAALAYARLMEPERCPAGLGEPARRAVRAMTSHPEMVGGEDRLDTDLMRAAGEGLIAKAGAEGYYAIGFRRAGKGYGLAIKISDGGSDRGRTAAVLKAIEDLDLLPGAPVADLRAAHLPPVTTRRGTPAGSVEARFRLEPPAPGR